MTRSSIGRAIMVAMTVGLVSPAAAVDPQSIDWSKIPAKSLTLFYPGQSTYDWLVSPGHPGAKSVEQGQACLTCHKGSEKTRGNKIVKGGNLEPTPIPGKNGAVVLAVQAAHDAEYVYFRFQWKSQMKREGRMHDYVRFDGKQWKWYGHDRNDKAVRSGEQPAIYEDRLSIMLDDGKVERFAQQGCWLTCHNGMRDTRDQVVGDPVKKHPLFSDAKYDADIRKYLASTRTDPAASWDKTKSPEEIAKIKAAGGFLDLMQWRANRSGPVGMADDGYVLEYRNFDEGKNPFSWNIDRKTMTPLYMFDAAKVGAKALRAERYRQSGQARRDHQGDQRGAVRSQCRLEGRRHPARPSIEPDRRERLGRRQRRRLRHLEERHLHAGVAAQARYRPSGGRQDHEGGRQVHGWLRRSRRQRDHPVPSRIVPADARDRRRCRHQGGDAQIAEGWFQRLRPDRAGPHPPSSSQARIIRTWPRP